MQIFSVSFASFNELSLKWLKPNLTYAEHKQFSCILFKFNFCQPIFAIRDAPHRAVEGLFAAHTENFTLHGMGSVHLSCNVFSL